jgi:Zn-dependent protease with chaperone function
MDFFAEQDAARRRTRRLVALFALAVAAIVVAVYLAATVLLFGAAVKSGREEAPVLWEPGRFAAVAGAVLLVVVAGSLFKMAMLRRGGAALAELLGGRRLDPAATDLDERRLLNVVEEMALASGVPVPTVYLLDEELRINAFAAGFSPSDAVVGVTRGALRRLDRQELQGVVAHEFSHLLNGDMRLNLRLVGLLHGILVIAFVGEMILRGARRSGGSGRGKRGGGGAILLFGLALYLIGWIGVFFGRLIKAGVSRQREFLADAAAVQFTRDPGGIGGALKKIGGRGGGSQLRAAHAEEASHFYFADGLASRWLAALSTHPPLRERIRKLDPAWDGRYPELAPLDEERAPARPPADAGAPVLQRAIAVAAAAVAAGELAARAGAVRREHLERARALLASIPVAIRQMAREPLGAQAVVAALLLDSAPEVRARQLARLDAHPEPDFAAWARRVDESLPAVRDALRLPLVELALPALRGLSAAQYTAFRALARALVEADARLSLFELVLEKALSRHLAPHFGEARPARVDTYSLAGRTAETSQLLSAVARATHRAPEEVEAAFVAGAAVLAERGVVARLVAPEEHGVERLEAALAGLDRVALPWKRALVDAAAAAAAHDGRLDPPEAELLRAIADGLGVPLPLTDATI